MNEWQQQGEDRWVFGVKVRGFVRDPEAVVYCLYGSTEWSWHAGTGDEARDGSAQRLDQAIEAAEKALGVT